MALRQIIANVLKNYTAMKKVVTILGLMILTISMKAQISLEHSFNSQGYYTWYFNTEAGIRYYGYNTTTNQLTFYNIDYSVYKTITMNIASGYKFNSIYCVSDKLFNSDNLIEFIFVTYNGTDYSMKLYDENQNELKDFGSRYYAVVVTGTSNTKLFVRQITYNSTTQLSSYLDEIYSLPGSLPTSVSTLKFSNIQTAYPNPTNKIINLPYELENEQTSIMRIYNSNGQLLDQKQINSTFDRIILNVESYHRGIYYYEYNGISNKFIVE
jgi:hypothetical protein